MEKITSRTNQKVKAVVALTQKKHRVVEQKFLGHGLRVCQTLVQNGTELHELFVTEAALTSVQPFASKDKITLVSEPVMEKLSSTKTPSGILGVFNIPQQQPELAPGGGLVLTQMSDPGNVGTLIRTSAALGKKNIVLVEGVDPWAPKVVQASAGTIGAVHIFQCSWQQLLRLKKDRSLYALVVTGGSKPSHAQLHDNLLVVGSEAHGIPGEWVAQCDGRITLPMPGGTESLNAAVAGSIALYLSTNHF